MKSLTLCLMTCGELTEKDCLESIEHEKHNFFLQEVRNVTPQIKALNLMLSRCGTQYLVPLDSDFILNRDFYQRIDAALEKHDNDPKWHSILFPLFDTFTQQKILALKILRMSVMKQCPFVESNTPDVQHYQDLQNLGYSCIHEYLAEKPIGAHVVKGEFFCYHKYKDVYQTMRYHKKIWDDGVAKGQTIRECALSHYNFFMSQYNSTKNTDYLAAIQGILDGLQNPLVCRSKDLGETVNFQFDGLDKKFMEWILYNKNSEFKEKIK